MNLLCVCGKRKGRKTNRTEAGVVQQTSGIGTTMIAQEERRWTDFLCEDPTSRAYGKSVEGSCVGRLVSPRFDRMPDSGTPFTSMARFRCDVPASDLLTTSGVVQDMNDSTPKDSSSSSSSSSDHDDSDGVCEDDEEMDEHGGFYDPWSSSEDECDITSSPMHGTPEPHPAPATAIQPGDALNEPLFLTYRKLAAARDAPPPMRKKIPVAATLDTKDPAARIRVDMKRERHNSTNTCLVCSVIPAPNVNDLVHWFVFFFFFLLSFFLFSFSFFLFLLVHVFFFVLFCFVLFLFSLFSVSSAVHLHVERHSRESDQHVYFDLFDENLFPLTVCS